MIRLHRIEISLKTFSLNKRLDILYMNIVHAQNIAAN